MLQTLLSRTTLPGHRSPPSLSPSPLLFSLWYVILLPVPIGALLTETIFQVGDHDDFLAVDKINDIKKVFENPKGKGHTAPLGVKVFENAVHGFAVGGDDKTPEEKKANESINFLSKYLAQAD